MCIIFDILGKNAELRISVGTAPNWPQNNLNFHLYSPKKQKNAFTVFLAPTGKWEALWTALSQREAVAVDAAVVDAAVVDAEEEEEENSHFLQ